MSEKRFKDEKSCSNCRNQMTGFDGGFFGLPFTCECRIYGETEGRKNCPDFEKKITKSYLLDKINKQQSIIEELKTHNLQHFLEWLVIEGYVTDESMKDINNVIDCVNKFKEYLEVLEDD